MLISEAFNLYRDDYIRLKNQSRRTEETHETCKRLLIQYVQDKPIECLTLSDIREWCNDLAKTRAANSVRSI